MQESQVCYPETDMPLNETDKAWIREQIQEARKRHGWGKLTGAIKDWSGAGAAIAILIFAATQWTAYVEFRTQTNDRLGTIEKKLTTSELQSQASLPQPAFEKALPEVRSTIAAALKDRISVPPALIEGLKSKLLASNSAAPDFWPTLSEFVSYRSALSYHAAAAPAPLRWVYSFANVPDCVDSPPKPMRIVSTSDLSKGVYENCRFVLDSAEQDQKLNAILSGNTPAIVFQNCLIEYHGGDINLILAWNKAPFTFIVPPNNPEDKLPPHVYHLNMTGPAIDFQNCLFNFSFQNTPSSNGQLLSTALLAQDAASASLPVAR
jgi:hypothetical protein